MTRLAKFNDIGAEKIKLACQRMEESATEYWDDNDAALHLQDVHEQFKILAEVLKYEVKPMEKVA